MQSFPFCSPGSFTINFFNFSQARPTERLAAMSVNGISKLNSPRKRKANSQKNRESDRIIPRKKAKRHGVDRHRASILPKYANPQTFHQAPLTINKTFEHRLHEHFEKLKAFITKLNVTNHADETEATQSQISCATRDPVSSNKNVGITIAWNVLRFISERVRQPPLIVAARIKLVTPNSRSAP